MAHVIVLVCDVLYFAFSQQAHEVIWRWFELCSFAIMCAGIQIQRALQLYWSRIVSINLLISVRSLLSLCVHTIATAFSFWSMKLSSAQMSCNLSLASRLVSSAHSGLFDDLSIPTAFSLWLMSILSSKMWCILFEAGKPAGSALSGRFDDSIFVVLRS